jgi:hypothetical protein
MAGLPLHPKHPERVCWGCDRYCPAHDLTCGNGSERTPHPEEIFGPDWLEWAASNAIEVGGADPSEHLTEASRAEPAGEECRPFVSGQACRGRNTAS